MTDMAQAEVETRSGRQILLRLAGTHRASMILLAVTSFLGAMLEAGFLVLLTGIVLALADGTGTVGPFLGHSIGIIPALLGAATAIAVRLILNIVTAQVSAILGARVRTEQRQALARAFLRAEWGVQQSESAGRLQQLLGPFVGTINTAMQALTQGVTAVLSLVAFLSAGLSVDAGGMLIALGALAVLGLILAPIRRLIRRQARTSIQTDMEFATSVAELGALGLEMQTFGVRSKFEEHLDSAIHAATEQQRRVQFLSGLLAPLYTTLAYVAVIIGAAAMHALGVSNVVSLGAVMLLMLRSLSYAQQLMTVSGNLAASIPSLERVHEAFQAYSGKPANAGERIPTVGSTIQFENVTFAYRRDRPAIHDVTLSIPHGEMLGVIGPSGAGKSTFAQLLLGLRVPELGTVKVGDVPLTDIQRDWWATHVSFVAQDPLLITGTVAENLRFFRDGITDEDLRRAAAQANVLRDIEALPNGFDTHLGVRGSQLSGGQRQRVAIARAMAGRPAMLILDEPTSALDGSSENLIRSTLGRLHGEITIVIIAHRMSTLDLCDRVLVIEDGRVTGLDQAHALVRDNAFYRRALETAGLLPRMDPSETSGQ